MSATLVQNRNQVHAVVLVLMSLLEFLAVLPWNSGKPVTIQVVGNMLSYGTALSNLLAAVIYVLAAAILIRKKEPGKWFGYVRGAGVFYMLCTLLAYALLMQEGPYIHFRSGSFQWNNFILHLGGPLFIFTWWILFPPRRAITYVGSILWLTGPLVYILYTLIHGARTNWYPYSFLDPAKTGGAHQMTINLLFSAIGFIALCQLVAWIGQIRTKNTGL